MLLDTLRMFALVLVLLDWIVRHSVGCFVLFVLLDLLFPIPVGCWSTCCLVNNEFVCPSQQFHVLDKPA